MLRTKGPRSIETNGLQKEEQMGRRTSVRAVQFMGRTLALACLLSMGAETSFSADLGMVSERADMGDAASTWLRGDRRNTEPAPRSSVAWKVSVSVFAAMQAADAGTSYGYREANPIYGQRFGARGIALKALIAVAVPFVERRIIRHHQGTERAFTALNFGLSGATSRAVIYNARDMASKPAPIGIIPGVPSISPPH